MSHAIGRVGRVISCVYCGGEHARPADVKQCWADGEAASTAAVDTSAPSPAPSDLSGTGTVTAGIVLPIRRGPTILGRHVIVESGAPAPDDWAECERLELDAAAKPFVG